jgi:tetratricopeptide (TPR) repeat protein
LAQVLKQQGRLQAVAAAVRALFDHEPQDISTTIQAVELLDDCGRKRDAAAICEAEIATGSIDARIHAYAGMLEIQLGEFERARRNYSIALANSAQAIEWNIPIGLSRLQRYSDNNHADFHLFRKYLENPQLSEKARTTILFALGKAHDDIGDYAQAANYLRQANTMAHAATAWSRKHWRRATEARIARAPLSITLPAPGDWTPVFVVGVMRSGTTLVAELLSRHPDVCNRGELSCLPVLAQKLSGIPQDRIDAFAQAAATYESQLRQDDSDAHWFIDKQPMNLMHVDLIMALWPNARIVYCKRNPRDTALSLWSQSFLDDAQGYAYDFTDIATVIRDCGRVMAHWHKRHAQAIHTVSYEKLTADPAAGMTDLAEWLGAPPCDLLTATSKSTTISTASLWQARQPVYTGSVERWRHYAPYLPELLRIPAH